MGLAEWVLVGEGEKNYTKLKREGKRKKKTDTERERMREKLLNGYTSNFGREMMFAFSTVYETLQRIATDHSAGILPEWLPA